MVSTPCAGAVHRPAWVLARPGVLGLYAAFALATLADSLITGLGVQVGMPEANPVTRLLIATFGAGVLPLTKVPALAAGALAARRLPWSWAQPLLVGVTMVTAAAVVWDCAMVYHLSS